MTSISTDLIAGLRPEARNTPESGIITVIDYGWDKEGLIPLWAGESDMPTPAFICDEASRSLAAGETFYTYQRGLPELRQALADYHTRHYDHPFTPERFIVVGSGMQAVHFAIQATAGAGASVIVPTPSWPNSAAAVGLSGARSISVPMTFGNRGWSLDLDAVIDAADDTTRAIFINSPGNPTGWVMKKQEMADLLAFCRTRGIWIISDEVYSRFTFDGSPRAPSFYDVAEPDDRVLYVNTFSKNWAMTGWRIGWIGVPEVLGDVMENLVQYNTSGVAAFMQRAAITALTDGEPLIEAQVARSRVNRDIVCDLLEATGRVRLARPEGGYYAFFEVDGYDDTTALALRLIDEAEIGLAPGDAFGVGGERFMRFCFARKTEDVAEAAARLSRWLTGETPIIVARDGTGGR